MYGTGKVLPLVRSERKDMDIPDRSASSYFVIPRSSSSRSTLVRKIRLYT